VSSARSVSIPSVASTSCAASTLPRLRATRSQTGARRHNAANSVEGSSSPVARAASAVRSHWGTSRAGSGGITVSATRARSSDESTSGAWPSPLKNVSGSCPESRSSPSISARPSAPPPSASAEPQTTQHVIDMVAHRRAVLRPGIARAPRPTGQRLFGRQCHPRQRRARRSLPPRARRASWDHFKNAAQHVHLE
jgi:hypothetical protein